MKTNDEIKEEITDEINSICDEITQLTDRVLKVRELLKRVELDEPQIDIDNKYKLFTTSTGHEWSITDRTAKDLTSGLIWQLQDESGCYTHQEALDKFGDKLPTTEEFEIAESHGCREVLKFAKQWYWSASVCSFYRAYAWIFNGALGNVSLNNRSLNIAVRCVGR